MRYYELNLYAPGSSTPSRTWTSHPGGKLDQNALNIEFDIVVMPHATPHGGSTITLEGVALADLMQAQQFGQHYDNKGMLQRGMTLELKGGMKAGLPLANPAQAGTIIKGQVFQSFGNWKGTEMTLDFVVYPSDYTTENPGNFVLDWRAGQPLADALRQCLSVAYPDAPIQIDISDRVVATQDMPHFCGTLDELAQVIKETTGGNYIGPTYVGVDITVQGGAIVVFDGTAPPPVVEINFTDLIGQPTWVDVNQLQMQAVMRGDVQVGANIKMPPSLINSPGMVGTVSGAMPSSVNYQPTFQGQFMVTGMRQIGNLRATDGDSWATLLTCVPYIPPSNG